MCTPNTIIFYTRVRAVLVQKNEWGENMLESKIEGRLRWEVKKAGGMALKFISPETGGVPDRLVLLPGKKIFFVELKSLGKNLWPLVYLLSPPPLFMNIWRSWVTTQKFNISPLESGTYHPSLDFLFKVARSLGKEVQIILKSAVTNIVNWNYGSRG